MFQKGDIVKVVAERLNRKYDSFVLVDEVHEDFFYSNNRGFYKFNEVVLVCPFKERYDIDV